MAGYIGRTKDDIIHASNGTEIHLPGGPNVKVDCYSAKTEVFEVFFFLAWVSLHA